MIWWVLVFFAGLVIGVALGWKERGDFDELQRWLKKGKKVTSENKSYGS